MSRGPGRWQRVILAGIEDREYDIFPILALAYDHLGRDATRSEAVAARRAVKTLVLAGKVRAVYRPSSVGSSELCVIRPDSTLTSWQPRIDAPGWITWLDGKTDHERTLR